MPRTINASEIIEKTRSEIRALAAFKGLIATRQPDSAGLPRKWKYPCAGNQRLPLDRGRIDQRTGLPCNDPKAAVDHVYVYQSDGLTKNFVACRWRCPFSNERAVRMNQPVKRYTSTDGCIDAWIEQESSIHLKSVSKFGDPVELTAGEVRILAENLNKLAEILDKMDK